MEGAAPGWSGDGVWLVGRGFDCGLVVFRGWPFIRLGKLPPRGRVTAPQERRPTECLLLAAWALLPPFPNRANPCSFRTNHLAGRTACLASVAKLPLPFAPVIQSPTRDGGREIMSGPWGRPELA